MPDDLTLVSLIGSAFSAACTAYFWFVRVQRERPDVTAHLLEHEFFLGQGRADERAIGFKLAVVLANNSILPDAVLGARVWLRTAGGQWLPLEGVTCDQRSPLPLNLPPQQTGILRLAGRISFATDDEAESQRAIAEAYVARHLSRPLEITVQTLGLNERVTTSVLYCDPQDGAAAFRVRSAA
jgi:hypothetical protein